MASMNGSPWLGRELCERPQPLTPDEARLMDFEDVILVGSVREKVRNQALTVDSAGIRDCIEALGRGGAMDDVARW